MRSSKPSIKSRTGPSAKPMPADQASAKPMSKASTAVPDKEVNATICKLMLDIPTGFDTANSYIWYLMMVPQETGDLLLFISSPIKIEGRVSIQADSCLFDEFRGGRRSALIQDVPKFEGYFKPKDLEDYSYKVHLPGVLEFADQDRADYIMSKMSNWFSNMARDKRIYEAPEEAFTADTDSLEPVPYRFELKGK